MLYLLFCLLYFSLAGHAQKNVLFPQGAGVVDVTKAPYFAKGDGITDDTDAINQAMLDHPDGHFIIYLPNGTYLVSDRIDWPRVSGDDTICGTEQSCRYTILQGQNRDSTIIKLKDNAAGYQDNTNRRAVLWCGQGVAQRFRNAVRDLTVNIGTGNAGASGIQFNANNQGGIFDVKVESNDGQGVYGIDLAYTNEIGPLLVKNVEVDGFQRAVSTNFNVNSMTFENLTIRNQSDVGIYVLQQVVTIRGLQSFNEVTAVRTRNQGSHLVLIDSELNGQGNASNLPAIFYGTDVFLRNVTTPGYRNAVSFNLNGTTPITRVSGDYIDEYVSSEPIRLCDNIEKSLNLPVLETPDVPVEDTTLWVNVEDFGARIDKTGVDDAAAIQAAMNSGASTIYIPVNSFRNGGYTVLSDISVPGTVRRIIGTEGGISGSGRFILIDGTDDLIIERVRNLGGGIIHDADRTLIVKSSTIRGEYSCSSGADLFLEDVGFPATTFTNQNVWARQYNTERTGISIINDNSNLWILGLKTEKSGTKIKTINGGRTEVLGAHIYSISESTDEFMFIVEDGSLSLAGIRETNFNNDPYPNLIKETRNGFTRELVAGQANFGINGSGFPLFVGYAAEGTNSAPTVSVGDDITLVFPLDSVSIIGEVNDDGLPGSQCFASHEWTQIAGPESAVIDDPLSLGTNIIFEEPGVYTFRLSASDGDLMASDDVNIYVYEKTITTADHDGDGAPSGNGADTYVGRGGGRAILNYGGATGIRIRNHPGIFD
ncbi:MAG: glycosyl hydrolase family 28-related protein, partial [Bacteroidota bacterium]